MAIREVQNPILKDLICRKPYSLPISFDLSKIKFVGSGKAAITLILDYLKSNGVICNKLDEILVPDWLGSWVYNQIQKSAFPAKKFSLRTKVLFVYHQYGFPQDMDKIMDFAKSKKLIVVEDCAHALKSFYRDHELGSFGDFSIYSFSKWFFCFACGGIKSDNTDFLQFVARKIKLTPIGLTWKKDLVKYLYEKSTLYRIKIFEKYAKFAVKMTYAIYEDALKASRCSQNLVQLKIDHEIEIRQKRYQAFLKNTDRLGICRHLEQKNITPYIIPIIAPLNKLDKLCKKLIANGVQTGIYNFDIKRNMFEPNFVPCLWIPCHSGISCDQFDDITEIVIQEISK